MPCACATSGEQSDTTPVTNKIRNFTLHLPSCCGRRTYAINEGVSAALVWQRGMTEGSTAKRVAGKSQGDFCGSTTSSATGASDKDIAAVRSFAGEYGLEVTSVDKGRRAMTLRGTVKAVAEAFGAQELETFEHPSAGRYRGRPGVRLGEIL